MLSKFRNVSKLLHGKWFLPASSRSVSLTSESGVIKSLCPDIDIPNISLTERVLNNFNKFPKKIAVECALTGRSYTYEDVLVKSKNFSRALRKKLKLSPGDVVALLLPNIPEYPICIYGCLLSGIPITSINPIYTPDEICKQLLDADVKVLVTLASFHSIAAASVKLLKKDIAIITIKTQESEVIPDGSINIFELFNTKYDIDDLPPPNANDTALIPYSSGTTGLPKGVPLTHKNLVANLSQINHPNFRIHYDTTDNHQDVVPAILPFYHIFGATAILFVHMCSLCKLVCLPKFTPELFTKMLVQSKPNIMIIVPSIVNLIANEPAIKKEYLESVRTFFSGAAPLSKEDEERLTNKLNRDKIIRQGYGLTETSPAIFMSSLRTQELGIIGTVGELLPNTVIKIISSDNSKKNVLSPGEPGELLVKGPQVMKGYHKRTDNENFFEDGYFKTGDMVYYDEHRSFYVVDRLKELIKVQGFQVAPAELEGILREHPDVIDAAVIGIPHSQYGEVPRAYLVPKPKRTINSRSIQEFVSNKVAKYKQLKGGISVIDSIPKNNSGKIMRKELKSLYASEAKV